MGVESRFSCYVIGSESLLVQCAGILRDRGHEIRGIASKEPAIVAWARGAGIPVLDPDGDLAAQLAGEFDYLFSITNLKVLPEPVLRRARRAAINFHDGPLPAYAGLYAPAWALMQREPRYGISWHVMKPEVDEGEILAQQLFDVAPGETSLTINTKCYEAAIESFGPLCDALAAGTARPIAQDLSRKSYFGKWQRPRAACTLDFSRPAVELEALVRALDFGRYENPLGAPKLHHRGRAWTIASAQARDAAGGAEPGTVLAVEADAIVVATGDGALRLAELSEPRGRQVPVQELVGALGIAPGTVLEGARGALAERLDALNTELCRAEAFWVDRLASLDPIELPYLRAERAAKGAAEWRTLPLDVPAELARPGAGGDALIAAFVAWLARICDRTELDVAFRDDALRTRVAGLEAFASDVVPLRVALDDSGTVEQALAASLAAIARTRKRPTFLHDAIARHPRLRARQDLIEGRLLPVLAEVRADASPLAPPPGTLLAFVASPDGSGARLEYDARALDDAGAASLRTQWGVFAAALAAQQAAPLARLPLLAREERTRVLETWNATDAPYPTDRCIHQLIEEQARRTPDRAAVSFEGEALSYRELNSRANRLAAHLRGLGVGPDQLVGVFTERSLEMVVALLGIHKAGGAYVPLDPTYPRDRIAFMLEDSGAKVVLTQERVASELPSSAARVVRLDADWPEIATRPDADVASGVTPSNLAYVIYTSGSTGRPKGVMVEHRNVVNFFAGMDAKIPHDPSGVWLAVTSLSFDISVLELLWTLARGFEVVVYAERERAPARAGGAAARKLDFGLFLWGSDDAAGSDKYRLMLESARYADRHGFGFVSTPERHFHAFGGPYPNASITSAAIAAVTERVQIRAGSCVLPLHHPVRVAEEWAVVDNLSNGRVAISFAAGWQPNDFVIRPEGYAGAKTQMFRGIDTVQRLWRGETVEFANPMGTAVPTRTLPRPVQRELPTWVTTAGSAETYRLAGSSGANLLTHLLGQTVEEVGEKIKIYRAARAEAGLDPEAGIVTLMLHTFVGGDDDEVRETVRKPMKDYLASSVSLVKGFAWAFPAFKRPGGPNASPEDVDLDSLSAEELDAILEHAFERYFETSGLFGTPETCAKMIERVRDVGVNEIACLIDYGVPTERVLASLDALDEVRRRANPTAAGASAAAPADLSLAAQLRQKHVTHMQCTPSMAKMIAMNAEMREALGAVRHLYIGGEAFPASLARELSGFVRGTVTNMYGPTETTIWSTTHEVHGAADSIPIGRPIANTQVYLLDRHLEPVPVGVAGELFIAGDGVVRGYHGRAELTAERFLPDPFARKPGARMYRTGDLARHRADGTIEFLGRIDHQVKIRGYRIELGEIETELGRHPGVQECVVVAREEPGQEPRLVGYLVAKGTAPSTDELREHLRETLPEFMVPAHFVALDAFPLTPNGKIDRKRLPAPERHAARAPASFVAPRNDLERTIADAWRDALKLESVGTDDNFFDLGGHSLLVVQVHRRLREQVQKPLSLTDLYRFPTIRTLAEFLTSEGGDDRLERSKDRGAARRESMLRRQQSRRRPGGGDA